MAICITNSKWKFSIPPGVIFVIFIFSMTKVTKTTIRFLHKPSLDNYMKQQRRIKHIEPKSPLPGISPFATVVKQKYVHVSQNQTYF